MADEQRNLNPSKEAVIAMWLWGSEYSAQHGGSMDFWDKLSKRRKQHCKWMVDAIEKATWRSEVETAI